MKPPNPQPDSATIRAATPNNKNRITIAIARLAGPSKPRITKNMTTLQAPTPRIGKLALRVVRGKPAHHLWNNNGTWWVHYSIRHPEGGTKRYRQSLKTRDFDTACTKRDKVLLALIRSDSTGGIPL